MSKDQKQIYFHFATFINSLSIFLISYIIILFIYYGLTVFIAYDFEISSILFYNSLEFLNSPESPKWTFDATVSVMMAGPIACLFIGTGALILLSSRIILHPTRADFAIWMFILGFNFFFGQIINGFTTGSGINMVANVMHVPAEFKILFVFIAIYLLGLTGWYMAPGINNYAAKLNIEDRRNQILFLVAKLLLPWISGSLIIYYSLNPNSDIHYKLINVYIGLIIIPAFFSGAPKGKQTWILTNFHPKPQWIFVSISAVMIFTYYIFLKDGKVFIY